MTEEQSPEVYADLFWFTLSPYTALLEFAVRPPPPRRRAEPGGTAQDETPQRSPIPQTVALVRMSPEHAKVMAIILRRHIQNYEQRTGINIDVPGDILRDLNIPPEDWRQFTG